MNKHFDRAICYTIFFLITAAFCATTILAGDKNQTSLWQKINDEKNISATGARTVVPEKYLVFRLAQTELRDLIKDIGTDEILMEIPMPDGSLEKFRMRNSQVLSEELAAAFPTWRNFEGEAVGNSAVKGRFDWNANGFHGYIFTPKGTVMIDPYSKNDTENYLVFYKHEFGKPTDDFYCNVREKIEQIVKNEYPSLMLQTDSFTYGTAVRSYRIAIATTGEWARAAAGYNGSQTPIQIRTAALAVVNTTVNRLNGIYEREIASKFIVVNPDINNSATNIIFDDPATDPYDNSDSAAQLTLNQTTIDAQVGSANYDIGHLYGTGGGGVALSPSVCENEKAQGYSARGTNTGDPFTVDYVAHEIGHQFGASHTYNQVDPSGTCTTRSASNAYEVASGSTIMSYVGICGARNLQQYVDTVTPSFHIRSLTQMTANLATVSCGTTSGTNAVPTVNAGASYTIPKLTPFKLTASGADTNGDSLLYSWEQYDLAPSGSGTSGTPAGTYDVDTDGVLRPLFRAYSPVSGNSRTFPSLNFILNPANNDPAGSNQPPLTYTGTHPTNAPGAVCETSVTCVVGERLPTVSRTMNFRVSVRDQKGGIADEGTTVTVAGGAGPFQITTQNSLTNLAPETTWQAGLTQTVTWDVANTDAAPVNAANVNILLSTDGGQTFPITLKANTPNDGTEQITVPNNPTSTARIKIEAVGNIFFDINNANFAITAATASSVSISGRILTSNGKGISGVSVNLTDQNGAVRTARTNVFGYYRFANVVAGETYIVSAVHKRFSFTSRSVNVYDEVSGFDITAEN